MKLNVGDKVKLMDQKGEGTVTKIISPTLVQVSIDGFELPYSTADLIKVQEPSSTAEKLFYEGKGSYDLPKEERAGMPVCHSLEDYGLEDASDDEAMETDGTPVRQEDDDRISPLRRGFTAKNPQPEGVYIALVPQDQQFMLKGEIDFYIINYTPHTLLYTLATLNPEKGEEGYFGVDYASVPPYAKIHVETVERADMDLWSEGLLQCLFFCDECSQWPEPGLYGFKINAQDYLSPERYTLSVFMSEKALLPTLTKK